MTLRDHPPEQTYGVRTHSCAEFFSLINCSKNIGELYIIYSYSSTRSTAHPSPFLPPTTYGLAIGKKTMKNQLIKIEREKGKHSALLCKQVQGKTKGDIYSDC